MENKRAYIAIGVVLLLASLASAYQLKRLQTAAGEHQSNQPNQPINVATNTSSSAADASAHTNNADNQHSEPGKIRILRASDLEDEEEENAEAADVQAVLDKFASAGMIAIPPEANATNEHKEVDTARAEKQAAARAFLNHYLANNRERARFCQQYGVSLDSFVLAFESAHQREINKSMAIFADIEAEMKQLYNQNRMQISQGVAQELNLIAQTTHASLKDACLFFDQNSASYVGSLQFSRVNPKQQQILVAD